MIQCNHFGNYIIRSLLRLDRSLRLPRSNIFSLTV